MQLERGTCKYLTICLHTYGDIYMYVFVHASIYIIMFEVKFESIYCNYWRCNSKSEKGENLKIKLF